MNYHSATLRGTAVCMSLFALTSVTRLHGQDETVELREKVAELERRLAEVESSQASERKLERLREKNRQAALERAAEDRKRYDREELAEIETLYQVANKNWGTDEARDSLKQLLDKYDRANRTGCATLYMGQMSEGRERIDYLTRAVEKFSDCYYLNGCQVGGYGRYVLALTHWQNGDKDKATGLLGELKAKYKDAIDHKGRPLGELAEAAEKQLAADQAR